MVLEMIRQQAKLVISEKDFQSQIIDALHLYGYRVMHSRPAMNRRGHWSTPLQGDPGFPDIVAARPERSNGEGGRLIFVEVKGVVGKLSKAQQEWLAVLEFTAAEVYVWKVGEITIEEIVGILEK